jgi:hypothetical protein
VLPRHLAEPGGNRLIAERFQGRGILAQGLAVGVEQEQLDGIAFVEAGEIANSRKLDGIRDHLQRRLQRRELVVVAATVLFPLLKLLRLRSSKRA